MNLVEKVVADNELAKLKARDTQPVRGHRFDLSSLARSPITIRWLAVYATLCASICALASLSSESMTDQVTWHSLHAFFSRPVLITLSLSLFSTYLLRSSFLSLI